MSTDTLEISEVKCKLCGFKTVKAPAEVRHRVEHTLENIKCTHGFNSCDSSFHKCEPCKLKALVKTILDNAIVDADVMTSVINLINKEFGYKFDSALVDCFEIATKKEKRE